MDIGWNPITQTYDKVSSSDFKEPYDTYDLNNRRTTKGRKRKTKGVGKTVSSHRYDPDSDVWDNSETRIWWWWEDNH